MKGRWLVAVAIVVLAGTAGIMTWQHARDRARVRAAFLEREHALLERKAAQVELAIRQIYQGARTISLLPSIRAIPGRNLPKGFPGKYDPARFSADARLTVQQVYNNLASNVSVSEVYCILDGFRPDQGETPFFMFDELLIGRERADEGGEEAENADFPEESEDAEYDYYARMLPEVRRHAPRFQYTDLDQIPLFGSPVLRTCDNSQYTSRAHGNPADAAGLLFSVPLYGADDAFKGVVSVIVRSNVFEAMLLDQPYIVVTETDAKNAQLAGWSPGKTASRFVLEAPAQSVAVRDRRAAGLVERLHRGGDLTMTRAIAVGPSADFRLGYVADDAELARLVRASDVAFAWRLVLVLVLGAGLTLFVLHVAREQHRVAHIRASLTTLASASSEVAGIGRTLERDSGTLNEGASKQAAGLEETSAALQELSSLASGTAERMHGATSAAGRAGTLSRTGQIALTRMLDTSTRMKQATEQTTRVVKVIDEIAFQTNLLALNAAVEAARAGAAGQGFAVVADEVRALALRSAESAHNTETLLESARDLAAENERTAREASEALNGVVEATQLIAHSFQELATASQEQAKGVAHVTQAMEQIEAVTVNTARLAQSAADASRMLSERASQLEGVVHALGGSSERPGVIDDDGRTEARAA